MSRNAERLLELAEIIEQEHSDGLGALFDMRRYLDTRQEVEAGAKEDREDRRMLEKMNAEPECGTVACIAGHTVLKWGQHGSLLSTFYQAQNLLGLSDNEAWQLFVGQGLWWNADLDDALQLKELFWNATRAQAGAVLRALAAEPKLSPCDAWTQVLSAEVQG